MNNKKYYTTSELAKILGISRMAVFKKIKNNQIKAEKIGRNYVIWKNDVENLVGVLYKDKLTARLKNDIKIGVGKVINEYGEALKKLGQE